MQNVQNQRRGNDRRQESTLNVDVAVGHLALVEDVDLPPEAEVEITLVVDEIGGVHGYRPVDPAVFFLSSWGQRYKTFFVRNLHIFVLSQSVC